VQKSFHDPGHVSELPVATYETQLNVVHYTVHKTTTAALHNKKGSPYSITEHRVPELIPVLGSQPAGDVSHKPGGRLPLHSARPAISLLGEQRHNGCEQFA